MLNKILMSVINVRKDLDWGCGEAKGLVGGGGLEGGGGVSCSEASSSPTRVV
jgi:hypothetical protein